MNFDWSDYLSLAELLHSDGAKFGGIEEACLRSATSRAYYAAFHIALEYAQNEGFLPKGTGEDHHLIKIHFRKRSSHPNGGRVSKTLDRMMDNRGQADYHVRTRSTPIALADMTVKSAQKLIEELKSTKSD